MGIKEKINAKFDEIFDFYQSEAVVYCQNNNSQHINELLLRRKELKNQKNYLLSIGLVSVQVYR